MNVSKISIKFFLLIVPTLLFVGCSTGGVMETINKPFEYAGNVAAPLLDPQLEAAATQEYTALVRKGAVPKSDPQFEQVKRVADRIIQAVNAYERIPDKDKAYIFGTAKGFKWDVNVIRSNQMNAFVMPGGKIAFYSGIMPVAENDDGIAIIMGHEVAHAILRHGRDRVVKNMGVQLALKGLSGSTGGSISPDILKYAGAGVNYGLVLPWSRHDEHEADELGLILAIIAGYDGQEAVRLWKRMAASSKGAAPPEIMSTHPSHTTRITNLSALAPKYQAKYDKYILR